MVDIVIDTREVLKVRQFFFDELTKLGHECEYGKLDAGDFLLYGKEERTAILIERKDDADFLGSLEGKRDPITGVRKEGRIWDQIKRMSETELRRYVLIEGNIYSKKHTVYRKMGWKKVRLWGALDGITKWGVHMHTVKNKNESVEWLAAMIKKQKRPKKEFSLRVSAPREMSLRKKQEYLLQGLPRIGPKASRAILDVYFTPQMALDNIDNWGNVRGIGKKMVANCKEVLNKSETLK